MLRASEKDLPLPVVSSTHLANQESRFIQVHSCQRRDFFFYVVSTVIKLESDNEVLLLLASLFIQKSSNKTHIMIVVFGG